MTINELFENWFCLLQLFASVAINLRTGNGVLGKGRSALIYILAFQFEVDDQLQYAHSENFHCCDKFFVFFYKWTRGKL